MKKTVYILSILILLTSCFGGRSKPSNFYNLVATETNILNNKIKLSIGIEPVNLPSYLDRSEIITIKNNGTEINISDFNRWADTLSTAIQRVLIQDMSILLPKSIIKASTFTKSQFDYIIVISINKLEAKFNDKAYLDAYYDIYNKNGKSIIRERITLETTILDTYSDLAQKYSILLSQLSQKIATKIIKLK